MLALEERRADLQAEMDSLVQQLSRLQSQLFDESATRAESTASPTIRSRRGALRDHILSALKSAGAAGVKVQELAGRLGIKPVNVHSWFHSALKKGQAITKISGGHYRLSSGSGATKSSVASTPQTSNVGRGRRRGSKRGQLSASILSELESAGSSGVAVSDLAKKLGLKYKNVYIWFATTGKKHALKKVAPATYSLAA